MAGLVAIRPIVSVGPPLFASDSSSGVTLSPIVLPLAPVLVPNPQVLSSAMLYPPFMTVAPAQSSLVLLPAKIELLTTTELAEPPLLIAPPEAEAEVLPEKVVLVMLRRVPAFESAPPNPAGA